MHQRPSARHYLLLGDLAFAWDFAFLFVKVGLADLAPIMVTLARTAVASGCYTPRPAARAITCPAQLAMTDPGRSGRSE